MQFMELTKKKFDDFALSSFYISFQQSSLWAKFKEGEGWHPYYVGLTDKNKIVAATVLLAKENKALKKRFFYAPRGFLLDYKNEELLKSFTKDVVDFIKEKDGIYLKVDPYIRHKQRDENGKVVEGGINNDFVKNYFINSGFTYVGDDFKRNSIQPRWLYEVNLENKSIDDVLMEMAPKARQIIRRNQRFSFNVRELKKDEFPIFVDLMDKVSKKYGTLSCTLPFYEDLYNSFTSNHMKIMIVEINLKATINSLHNQLILLVDNKNERIKSYQEKRMTEEVFIEKEILWKNERSQLENNLNFFKNLYEKEKLDTIILGGYLFILYGNEVVALQGAMNDEFIKLDGSYSIHYEMIKEAINKGYKRYNLHEISGNFNENDKLYGSYHFKRNFGGEVVELLGEFDYIIDKKNYKLTKAFFPNYYGTKIIYKKENANK